MRLTAPWRRMAALPVAIVAAVALLLQVAVAPGVFAVAPDGLAAICHAVGGGEDGGPPQPLSGDQHEHCLLCHAGGMASVLPPAAPRPAVPVAAMVASAAPPVAAARGAARPAYASRAPPVIG